MTKLVTKFSYQVQLPSSVTKFGFSEIDVKVYVRSHLYVFFFKAIIQSMFKLVASENGPLVFNTAKLYLIVYNFAVYRFSLY